MKDWSTYFEVSVSISIVQCASDSNLVSTVDHLMSAFEVLKNDLEFEAAKELYMHYKATPVILLHVKANCKVSRGQGHMRSMSSIVSGVSSVGCSL